MFQTMANRIYLYLSEKGFLNKEDKDIYIYAIEVLLLNGSLLTTIFILSICMGQVWCFAYFLCFFVPLRMFSGGYHASKSEICFPLSVISYMVILWIVKVYPYLYQSNIWKLVTIFAILFVYLFAPVENKNHPLDEYQRRRNRKIVRYISCLDMILLMVFWNSKMIVGTYEMVFVVWNGVLVLIGKWKNSRICTNN